MHLHSLSASWKFYLPAFSVLNRVWDFRICWSDPCQLKPQSLNGSDTLSGSVRNRPQQVFPVHNDLLGKLPGIVLMIHIIELA